MHFSGVRQAEPPPPEAIEIILKKVGEKSIETCYFW